MVLGMKDTFFTGSSQQRIANSTPVIAVQGHQGLEGVSQECWGWGGRDTGASNSEQRFAEEGDL